MRLPEAQVAHRVLGAIHSLPGVSIPDVLRHDSCDAPRLCRKARRPQFPWQRRRWVREAGEVLRAQSLVFGAALQPPAQCRLNQSLAERGTTAYLVCEQSWLTPKADFVHFTNEKTNAEPLAPFLQIHKSLWGPAPGVLNTDRYFFQPHHTAFHLRRGNFGLKIGGRDSQNVSFFPNELGKVMALIQTWKCILGRKEKSQKIYYTLRWYSLNQRKNKEASRKEKMLLNWFSPAVLAPEF